MKYVKPKKHLGQHFLKDITIAKKIVDSLTGHQNYKQVLEIGPGTGVLTDFLLPTYKDNLYLLDIDHESILYLHEKYPAAIDRIIEGDFLKMDLGSVFKGDFAIIGNFPYNISSQIFFKILDHRKQVLEIVCMLQKEVAERIASGPGNKQYGILSVLLQAYYDVEYLFVVEPGVFKPPPKVKSAVIRLKRNDKESLGCDEIIFRKLVKQGFQNRRKTLRNALKALNLPDEITAITLLDKRAEQLSVEDFVELTHKVQGCWNQK
jgi:16S rRNA (adenine1518-N6/adenine1519-N6)-dimethyltransferase